MAFIQSLSGTQGVVGPQPINWGSETVLMGSTTVTFND